ncbi:BZ3500_MvSof-1268-A1-R1_Chr2-1g04383 [Microbotryum saponariae]|uniref:BZ3500_MvSof-1268-A1-R1_Chr2-1g04383 protein n=1 Tax=Microbotryum saponariae TaxID=289078 RepID=A0A2X0K8F2_9BASI|nr:BZ3500_MvSof-1268-A1-R1_Chr2-1g04383 [Microbotryum saponariae]SCZ91597.1 BZ3501_MvSof-1269-A2-R1_Chr2-1g04039 [Microbotryum saponariae]
MSIRRPPTFITLKPSDVAEMQAFVQARQEAREAQADDQPTSDPNAPSSSTAADHNDAKRKKKMGGADGMANDTQSETIRARNERIGL